MRHHRFSSGIQLRCVFGAMIVLALSLSCINANTLVLPNSAEMTEGSGGTFITSGPFSSSAYKSQYVFSSSLLSGLNAGDLITGFWFRVDGGLPIGPYPSGGVQTWFNYNITMAKSAVTPETMSTTFASNMIDPVVVRSSNLFVLPGAYSDTGAGPNPFGFKLGFTTPYEYRGGDLIIMISHVGLASGSALQLDLLGTQEHLALGGAFRSLEATSAGATSGSLRVSVPVMQIEFTPAPEPGRTALIWFGLLMATGIRRRE